MKFTPELGFNILVLGRWNPSIFSPQWIKENVLETDVTLAIPMMDVDSPIRLAFSNIQIFPSRQALDARLSEVKEADIPAVGDVFSKIMELLRHTPVHALGINFRFTEEDNFGDIAKNFQFADTKKIPHEQYHLRSSNITRSFELEDGDKLNLSLISQNNKFNIEFNFHTDSTDVDTILKKLKPTNIKARLEEAKAFIVTTYGLALEE